MTEPNRIATSSLTGAFYWIPARELECRVSWQLLTCHDLHRWDGISHRELWPFVLDHLAASWNKQPASVQRRLIDHYYALPRGRVTHPGDVYLILHGNDAPIGIDWRNLIIKNFHLEGHRVETPWDEHETTLREDVVAFEEVFHVSLNN